MTTKRIAIVCLLCIIGLKTYGQQGFKWIDIHGGGRTNLGESVRSIQTDRWGNVYVAGRVNAIFYRDSLGQTVKMQSNPNLDSLLNYGGRDVWLAKYSKEGNLLWHRYAGGGNDETYMDMVADSDGNCYIAGRTEFHPIRPTYDMGGNLLGLSDLGAYIAKIDSGGNQLWHQTFGGDTVSGNFATYPAGILKLELRGNKLIAHSGVGLHPTGFQKLYDRDSLAQGLHELSYDLQGNYLGFKSLPTPFYLRMPIPEEIVSNGNETFYVGAINQDSVYIGNDTLFNSGFNNAFLISFDSSYNVNWIYKSDNYFDQFWGASLSGDSLFVSGLFDLFTSDTVTYDTITHFENPVTFQGSGVFVFDARNGRLKGLYPSKSTGFNAPRVDAYSLAINENFTAIGGKFSEQTTFSNTNNYLNSASEDCFFAVLDRSGGFFLEDQIISSGFMEGVFAMHLKDSMLYIGGAISDTARLNGVDTVITEGSFDAFVAAYRLSFTTSLEENTSYIKADNGILAYPNPTTSNTSLNLLGKAVGEDAILFNISGQEIGSYRLNTNAFNQVLRLGELKAGIYFLVIIGQKEKQSLKIMIN